MVGGMEDGVEDDGLEVNFRAVGLDVRVVFCCGGREESVDVFLGGPIFCAGCNNSDYTSLHG